MRLNARTIAEIKAAERLVAGNGALGDGAEHFAPGDAKGPSVQRRRSGTAAYPLVWRLINVGVDAREAGALGLPQVG